MSNFLIESNDYRRYGLDDPRCGGDIAIGIVSLAFESEKWEIRTETLQWTFSQPLIVRKLHERFYLHFTYKAFPGFGLKILVPFKALSALEIELLEKLSEQRHPQNAPGDFYGIASECICFGICTPVTIAPDLVSYQEKPEGCYFHCQPQTEAEANRAIEAVLSAFVDNLRYGGNDPIILQRMRKATRNTKLDFCQDDLCDYPTAESDSAQQS